MSVEKSFIKLVASLLPRKKPATSHLPGAAKDWLYPSQRLITDKNDTVAYAIAFVRDIEYGLDHNDKKIWGLAFEELKQFLKHQPPEIKQVAIDEANKLSQKWAKMISPGWHKVTDNFFKINGMEIHLSELARVLSRETECADPKISAPSRQSPTSTIQPPSTPAPA